MLVLAIDPATRTGWCSGAVGGKPRLGTVNFAGVDHPDVFARAMHWIDVQVSSDACMGRPDVLAIEEPVAPFQVQGQTQWATTQIALGLQGIFQGAARRHDIKVITAPIRTWRKYTLGAGAMKGADAKAAMVQLVRQLGWADEEIDHNAAEAAGIWLYAGAQAAPMQVTRHEPLFLRGIFKMNAHRNPRPPCQR
jgi:hypothetical protein